MTRRRRKDDRAATSALPTPAIVAAVALACAALAISGAQVAAASPAPTEARPSMSEAEAVRLVAVAVAAARELFGVDHSTGGCILARRAETVDGSLDAGVAIASGEARDAPHTTPLPLRLIDLPPPVC